MGDRWWCWVKGSEGCSELELFRFFRAGHGSGRRGRATSQHNNVTLKITQLKTIFDGFNIVH
jgi:hypothetical protein